MLRLGICQLPMCWSGAENVAAIVMALKCAAAHGVAVCLFPELTVTGIHRQIASQARPELVSGWLETVCQTCAQNGIAASVGAPTFTEQGQPRISQHFIDKGGAIVGTVHKSGLTAPEATFFTPGYQRPAVSLAGHTWSALICRELDDADQLAPIFAETQPELILWPGALRPDPDKPRTDPPEHIQRAQAFAARCGAFILMANWPNALNRPEESREAGSSVVIDPAGKILLTLPRAESGLAVFNLGQNQFDWYPTESMALS